MKMTPTFKIKKLGFFVLLSLFLNTSSVYAQDVDVYRTQASDIKIKPNLLFILDESGSMRSTKPTSDITICGKKKCSRTEELQAALRKVFAEPDPDDIDNDGDLGGVTDVQAAMLGYSKRQNLGRRIISDFQDVDENRNTFLNLIDTIKNPGGTTTVQAMTAGVKWYESGFTDDDGLNDWDGWNGIGDDGDANDTIVITPVLEESYCAANHIILLTDGAPYSDQASSKPDRHDPHPFKSAGYVYKGNNCTNPDPSGFSMSRAGCTGDIAEWAYNTDLFPSIKGNQNIVTQTIGFRTGSSARTYLIDIATRGGGKYYESNSTGDLVTAINAIVKEATASIKYTFNAPLIPFNATNTAATGNFIYVPVFEPSVTAFWKGNLKKYSISTSGDEILLSSANGGGTVLSSNSLFEDTAKSYWSNVVDGAESLVGGAITQFTGTRKLYTYVAGSTSTDLAGNAENHIITTNTLITHNMLGVSVPTNLNDSSDPYNIERKNRIEWINWTDADNLHEGEMGAAIHAQPAIVDTYGAGNDIILLPTSEGVLEAIDAATGEELWAFMPQELLANIGDLQENAKRTEPIYGLDGPMTVYQTNGKTMVVFGMRRGGKNYYALDITVRNAPEFAWQIIGGVSTNFTNLGQTWSKPLFLKMEITGGPSNKQVLVFGGGYDAAIQDGATSQIDDNLGRGVYVVNAETGVWIATYTPTGNNNGIASDVLPVDINANGIIDRLYAADVGGKIIRIDTPDSDFASTTFSSGIIADVNDGNTSYHQFFNTPEVGYFNKGKRQFLLILIGSGTRPDPLGKTVTDSFYMIKDPDIWVAPISYTTVARSDLYNTTGNLVQVGNNTEKATALGLLNKKRGWYIDMPTGSGEKIFSKARLYDFTVLFTTYSGTRANANDVCAAGNTTSESHFWAVNMLTGASVFSKLDGDATDFTTADRKKSLNIPGMPPSPTLVFPGTAQGSSGKVIALVGLQEVTRWSDRFHAIYWEEVIGNNYSAPTD